MKQLLFLLLFPCFALAQYQGNANQKITLGEQTTADGLVYRGVASIDTVTATSKITRANKQDTSAYILLDTVTNLLWHYKIGSNAWTQAGGGVSVSSFSAGTTGLTPSTATTGAVTLGGTLAVANGGTGSTTQNFVDLTTTQSIGGAKTFTSAVTATRFNPTANTATGTGMYLSASNTLGFSTNGTLKLVIDANGNLGIGVTPSAWFSSSRALQIGSSAAPYLALFQQTTSTSDGYLGWGAYLTGNRTFAYTTTGDAVSLYRLNAGNHIWFNAPSGTAGNPITFTQAMTLDGNGRLGIGTISPSEKLHVVGNGIFTAVGAGTFANNLNITSDGTLTTSTSDEKYKYNILPINYGLNTILQLKPVNFQWIEGEEQDLGFIAQDVADIIPEAVNTNWNSDLLMRYESIIPILTKAIQEQQALIKALEQRILTLENK